MVFVGYRYMDRCRMRADSADYSLQNVSGIFAGPTGEKIKGLGMLEFIND